LHLRQRRLVDFVALADELVGGEQEGGQRIDLLVAQRARLGVRHGAPDEIEQCRRGRPEVGDGLAAVEARPGRAADQFAGDAALAVVAKEAPPVPPLTCMTPKGAADVEIGFHSALLVVEAIPISPPR